MAVRRSNLPEEQTPLERLKQMNEELGVKRNRKPKPRHPEDRVEAYYRKQLRDLLQIARQRIMEKVVPVLKSEQHEFEDAQPAGFTKDAWSDRVVEALEEAIASVMANQAFQSQFRRLARSIVERADKAATDAVVKNVQESVGVDLGPTLAQQDLSDYVSVSAKQNVDLIKTIPQQYFDRVQNSVLSGVRDGHSVKKMMADLREAYNISESNAKRIARDQSAKLTSQITERRQKKAGIMHYRAVTANDNRVTGKPGGKYPNAKISCWGIANQDIGYGKGVYRWDEGATWAGQTGLHPGRHHIQCRCVAVPVFSWELPDGTE